MLNPQLFWNWFLILFVGALMIYAATTLLNLPQHIEGTVWGIFAFIAAVWTARIFNLL